MNIILLQVGTRWIMIGNTLPDCSRISYSHIERTKICIPCQQEICFNSQVNTTRAAFVSKNIFGSTACIGICLMDWTSSNVSCPSRLPSFCQSNQTHPFLFSSLHRRVIAKRRRRKRRYQRLQAKAHHEKTSCMKVARENAKITSLRVWLAKEIICQSLILDT